MATLRYALVSLESERHLRPKHLASKKNAAWWFVPQISFLSILQGHDSYRRQDNLERPCFPSSDRPLTMNLKYKPPLPSLSCYRRLRMAANIKVVVGFFSIIHCYSHHCGSFGETRT